MSNWRPCEFAGEIREGKKASGTPYIEVNRLAAVTLIYPSRLCKLSRYDVTPDTCLACPRPALIAAAARRTQSFARSLPLTRAEWSRLGVQAKSKSERREIMKLYKLTTAEGKSKDGNLRWGEGVKHVVPRGSRGRELCKAGLLHAYKDLDIAFLQDPADACYGENALAWEAEGQVVVDSPLKVGCWELTTLCRLQKSAWLSDPNLALRVRLRYAFLAARNVSIGKPYWPDCEKVILEILGLLRGGATEEELADAAYAADAAADAAYPAYETARAATYMMARVVARAVARAVAHAVDAAIYAAVHAARAAAHAARAAAHAARAAAHAAHAARAAYAAYEAAIVARATVYAEKTIDLAALAQEAITAEEVSA